MSKEKPLSECIVYDTADGYHMVSTKYIKKAVEDLSEVERLMIARINEIIPKENNHNFNRNNIIGLVRNEILILLNKQDKIFGEFKDE